jgi:hypothetical protein
VGWLRWLPLTFLLLQYPLSAAGLLAFNWPGSQHTGWRPSLLTGLQGVWPALVLSATLWLVDLSAVFILLAASVEAATKGLQECKSPRSWRWWVWLLLLPLEYLHWLRLLALRCLLPLLRAACLSRQLPVVAQVLGPKEGEEEVWAENHMFARMPMEALLEALPQVVLQVAAFFLAGGAYQPSLLSVMFSVTFSIVSMVKAVTYILTAGQSVRLGFWQAVKLLLQLQGSYRVPAAYMRGGPEEEAPMDLLRIKMPAVNLSPLQEAGYIHAKLAAHARRRAVAAGKLSADTSHRVGCGSRGGRGTCGHIAQRCGLLGLQRHTRFSREERRGM